MMIYVVADPLNGNLYFRGIKTMVNKQTCGNCEHSIKEHTGIVVLYCLLPETRDMDGHRSRMIGMNNKCLLSPSRWQPRKEKGDE